MTYICVKYTALISGRPSASLPTMDLQLALFPDDTPEPRVAVGPEPPTPEQLDTAARLSPEVRLGTSSWSFPGWRGIVYDREVSSRVLAQDGLEAYARHPLLRTVGIDRTWYRPIEADDFRRYADSVPEDFRFLIKADRLLTSPHDPEGYGVRQANPHFLDATYARRFVIDPILEGLGTRAGPLLFQFSPMPASLLGGPAAFVERLRTFFRQLPDELLYAVELRTPAFLSATYAECLEEIGVAHCYSVHPSMPDIPSQLRTVSPFYQPALVVRWMLHPTLRYEGAKERYAPFDRLVDEAPSTREAIARAVLDALVAERPAFVIANNKAEGSAPLTVFRLARRIASWEPEEES